MFSLVSGKFLGMRNIVLYSVFKSMLGRCDYVGSSFVGHKYLDFAHPFPLNVDFSERRT